MHQQHDQQGPEQVKLLFNPKRPGVQKRLARKTFLEIADMLGKEKIGYLGGGIPC